jgi:hypothetical protein
MAPKERTKELEKNREDLRKQEKKMMKWFSDTLDKALKAVGNAKKTERYSSALMSQSVILSGLSLRLAAVDAQLAVGSASSASYDISNLLSTPKPGRN